MKIPLSWLKEHIPISLAPADIAKILTMAGIEVEKVERLPLKFEGVVVGKITDTKKHPNAEKLTIATVTDGREYFQVVCGAPNCRRGLKTAFAKIGATITDDNKVFKIKRSKLRGEESCGMLCSAQELGLSNDGDKIMEFSDNTPEGKDLMDLYSDAILEIGLTPNLNHCASVIGIARELAALTAHPLRYPTTSLKETSELISTAVNVHNLDLEACPRYTCRVVKNVKVGPSPAWLQEKLAACGLRSINNVVDITNFVLLESGQPLHAFDYDQINLHTLIIRSATDDEKLVTLDGNERQLKAGDLIIADPDKPLAIAGVMGGQNSEVTEKTTTILLESAYFESSSVRRTSKRLGITTDASKRFERKADPQQAIISLNRAAGLIAELTGGDVLKDAIDIKAQSFTPKVINCSVSYINNILGTQLGLSEIETIFQRLQFRLTYEGQDQLEVEVPTYRNDLTASIDLVEEVARIYGYNHIPKPATRYGHSTMPHSPIYLFERKVKTALIAEGLQEFLTCDLISPTQVESVTDSLMPKESIVSLLNANSQEQSVLRPSLLPGLLHVVKHNLDFQNSQIWGFETGRIHYKAGDQFKEQTVAAIILSGNNCPASWAAKSSPVDFYDLKGIVENVLASFGLKANFKNQKLAPFHPGRQAAIIIDNLTVGSMGEIHPTLLKSFGISQRVYFAEINLHDLMPYLKPTVQMKELLQYPSSSRDWTITLKEEASMDGVFNAISSMRSSLLEKFALVAIYRSEKLGHDKKNATFNFVYRDPNKTLSIEEIENEHRRLTQGVNDKLTTQQLLATT